MTELQKAQKAIDRCNKKNGCNYYCRQSQKENCELLQRHRELLHEKADFEMQDAHKKSKFEN